MATAFAVFCADDGSLNFYKRDTVPAAGSTFEGKTVTAVYEGFETEAYPSYSSCPWHSNRNAVISISFVDKIKPANTSYWFSQCRAVQSININNLDTSETTGMTGMFRDCKVLTSLDLSSFDTSNVTKMDYMFYGCDALTTLDLSSFDTSKVNTMANMFAYSDNIESINLSSFDTSNVTNMDYMFCQCFALQCVELSSFDTSNVRSMYCMFLSCTSLKSLDLSSFKTNKVTLMNQMLKGCSNLQTVYVSDGWSTSQVTDSLTMFAGDTALVGDIPFNSSYTDKTYATYTGGYLTYKESAVLKDYLIHGSELYKIASAVRHKTGGVEPIATDALPTSIRSIVTLDAGTADATATASDILSGKTAYVNGMRVTGTASMPKVASGVGLTSAPNYGYSMTIKGIGFTPKKVIVAYTYKSAGWMTITSVYVDFEAQFASQTSGYGADDGYNFGTNWAMMNPNYDATTDTFSINRYNSNPYFNYNQLSNYTWLAIG